jgi:reverse gyrase
LARYNYFIHQDIETIGGILLYEQLKETRSEPQDNAKKPLCCKRCGKPLVTNPQDNRDVLKNIAVNVDPIEIKKGRRDYIIGIENNTAETS